MAALLSPRMLLLHAFAVAALVGTGWLGAWQVGAWQQNRQDKAALLVDAAPIPLEEAMGPDDVFPSEYVGQPVTVTGTWESDETVFVENKPGGRWVVTPLLTDNGSAVLVVRGASAQSGAYHVLGEATVTGWLQPGEAATTPDADPGDDVLPSLRITDVLERLDHDLYGGFVIAREPLESGLTPVTPDQLPAPGAFTSLRNLLYGVEWWVFGGFALFLWWRWCKDELVRARQHAQDPQATSSTAPSTAPSTAGEPEVPSAG